MKKILLLGVLIFGLATSAHALPLMPLNSGDNKQVTIGTNQFTVTNRSSSEMDTYNPNYYGYLSLVDDYTGYYLGTIAGNDIGNTMEIIIAYYLDKRNKSIEIIHKYKVDDIDDHADEGLTEYSNGPLRVTWNEDLKSGKWFVEDWTQPQGLGFYALKGSNEFSLYFVDPADTQGVWTTRHLLNGGLKNPAISHFTGATTPIPTPEPSTILLLGAGLLGLALYGRGRSRTQ